MELLSCISVLLGQKMVMGCASFGYSSWTHVRVKSFGARETFSCRNTSFFRLKSNPSESVSLSSSKESKSSDQKSKAKFPKTNYTEIQKKSAYNELLKALEVQRTSSKTKDHLSDSDILWYLRDRRYDVNESVLKLKKRLNWILSLNQLLNSSDSQQLRDEIQRELATNKTVVHPFVDKYGRRVLIVNAKHHVQGEFSMNSTRILIKSVLDELIEGLPDDSETILVVFDLRGFAFQNADLSLVDYLINVFFNYYPRRLDQVLFVEAPLIFRPTWAFVKPLLGQYSRIVSFVSRTQVRSYFNSQKETPNNF